ncbi:MAG: DinB family protein [Propionibacteriales bacterium]|nr:DinB family protein [Propionibacteriales bacterium]
MTILPPTFLVADLPEQAQLEAFLDEHRSAIRGTLDGLDEEQARRVLVPSGTTLLGLLKHAAFVEAVWFDEAITHRPRAEIGIPWTAPESYLLGPDETVASTVLLHEQVCERSRRIAATASLDDVMTGSRHGDFPLRWIYLHMIRELAEHCGHADILREQILAAG